ncbi:MAG: hypothetical protein RMJ98_12050, partial [Myxococcales bacterium]|nr:hypothetical protein [Polyangiaceae bacterium]MDW8250019.1 hypothetical protein [Myxococcales bacterium]
MPRLREPLRVRTRVLAPTWVSAGRLVAVSAALLGLGTGVLSLMGVLPSEWEAAFWLTSGGLGAAGLFRRQRRWAEADIEIRDGQVTILGARPGVSKLLARKIRALSTAIGSEGIVVAVSPGGLSLGPQSPVLIRADSPAQAEVLCDALAVGDRGLGTLDWFPAEATGWTLRRHISWLLALGSLLGLLFWSTQAQFLPLPEFAVIVTMLFQGLFLLSTERRRLRLDRFGVDLSGLGVGWGHIPYVYVEEVQTDGSSLTLRLANPYPEITIPPDRLLGLSSQEIRHLRDQIHTACLRSRGLCRTKQDPEVIFDDLRRGEDSIARWLQRLEAKASTLQEGAYRSEGSHNAAELWDALDNHDAPAEIRVAAARMLLRVQPDEARSRVIQLARDQREQGTREAL